MKRFIKSWVFIVTISILFICCFFYFYLLQDVSSQPSTNWSKGIIVKEVENSKVNESTRIRITTVPIPGENRSLIFWNEKDSIKYISIDSIGKQSGEKRIHVKLDEPVKLKAYIQENKIYFYSLESKRLNKYCYEYKKDKFYFVKNIEKDVNDFVYENGNLVVARNSELLLFDKLDKRVILCKPGGQLVALSKDDKEIYYIAIANSDGKGFVFVNYCKYNSESHSSKLYMIGKQFMGNNEMSDFDNIIIDTTESKVSILASRKLQIPTDTCRRLPRSTNNRILLYTFDKNNINPSKVKASLVNEISAVEPNPVKNYSYKGKFGFISSTTITKGKNSYSVNLRQYELEGDKVIEKELLTNTKEISREPFWYKLNNNEYLQWEDRTGTSTRIMFASTEKNIISNTGKLTQQEIWSTFLDSLMPLGFSLSYLLLLFSCIMLPTFIFIVLASMFFMNWAEANPQKGANIAIGLHILAELALLKFFDFKNTEVIKLEPLLLQNPILKILLVLLLTAVSYYCMKNRYKEQKYDKSFVNQYVFFAIVNMIMFALFIFPYYYI